MVVCELALKGKFVTQLRWCGQASQRKRCGVGLQREQETLSCGLLPRGARRLGSQFGGHRAAFADDNAEETLQPWIRLPGNSRWLVAAGGVARRSVFQR